MSEWHNIGRISPVPAGTWNSAKSYKRLDIVTDSKGEKSYIALKDVPSGTALNNAAYWQLIADVSEAVANANSLAVNAVNRLTSPFTKNGDIVVCNPVEQHPLDAKSIVEPVQSGSGDPSPSNIRTIGGHTGAKLTRCGKNLLPLEFNVGTSSGVTVAKSDGVLTLSGTASSTAVQSKSFPTPLPPGQYAFSLRNTVGSATVRINLSYADGTDIASLNCGAANAVKVFTATKPITTYKLVIMSGSVADCTMIPQLEFASAVTEHEPYRCDAFSASFGQTVYGGTLDWNTGVLTVDWAFAALNGSELQTYSGGVFQTYALSTGVPLGAYPEMLCSHYKAVRDYNTFVNNDQTVCMYGNGAVRINDSRYTNFEDFKAYIVAQYATGTPVQVAYKLANPIEIQLTPQQILGLKGVNTLYSDCGKTDVSGRIDPEFMNEQLKNAIIALGGNV